MLRDAIEKKNLIFWGQCPYRGGGSDNGVVCPHPYFEGSKTMSHSTLNQNKVSPTLGRGGDLRGRTLSPKYEIFYWDGIT